MEARRSAAIARHITAGWNVRINILNRSNSRHATAKATDVLDDGRVVAIITHTGGVDGLNIGDRLAVPDHLITSWTS